MKTSNETVRTFLNDAVITSSSSQTPSSARKGNNENLITRTNGAETSNIQIDYIAVSNEQGNWGANAQTNKRSSQPQQHDTTQNYKHWHKIRHNSNKQTSNNRHINFDIKQLSGNATQLQRGQLKTSKYKKLTHARNIYIAKSTKKPPNTPEQAQTIAKRKRHLER